MSDHDDHEVLDEDRSPRSNGSHSPRPAGRSPSRSRSRSRSPPPRRVGGGRGGNSRSRSRSPGRRYSGRRSPVARRRSHYNGSGTGGHSSVNRENPAPSRCLGIFGLSMYTEEHEIRELFGRYGRIEEVKIVYDAQTARSRGFGFVYFDNEADAAEAKERCNGINLGGRDIRVDFSVTQRAHTPTPGIYMGKKSRQSGGGGGGGGGGGRGGGFRRDGGGDRSDRGYDRGGGYGRSRDGGYGGSDRNGGGYERSGGYGGDRGGGFDRRRSPVGGSSYGRRSGGGGMRYSRSRSRSPPRQRHYR